RPPEPVLPGWPSDAWRRWQLRAVLSDCQLGIIGTCTAGVETSASLGKTLGQSNGPYGFGERRFAPLALLTLIALSGRRSCGVAITKFSGHSVTLRSSPTVFADTPTSRSTSTRILEGKPPRATWSAARLLGLYRIWAPCCRLPDRCSAASSTPAAPFLCKYV